jgi:hypothetical protein
VIARSAGGVAPVRIFIFLSHSCDTTSLNDNS